LDLKAELYEKAAPFLHDRAIFASNTSGLSINKLAEAVPESLRPRFCGIHFFNPPRYMHLVEFIPSKQSDEGGVGCAGNLSGDRSWQGGYSRQRYTQFCCQSGGYFFHFVEYFSCSTIWDWASIW
jgi:hypothetical protein